MSDNNTYPREINEEERAYLSTETIIDLETLGACGACLYRNEDGSIYASVPNSSGVQCTVWANYVACIVLAMCDAGCGDEDPIVKPVTQDSALHGYIVKHTKPIFKKGWDK